MQDPISQPSKFKNFVGHPVTIEILRFVGYATVTFGGKWLFGKAATAYRTSKAEKQLSPSQRQPHPSVAQNQQQAGPSVS